MHKVKRSIYALGYLDLPSENIHNGSIKSNQTKGLGTIQTLEYLSMSL
jgi:hypothetical protein